MDKEINISLIIVARTKSNNDHQPFEMKERIKKCDKKLLRISRTKNKYRDFMLYYLHKRNYIDECVIEHPDFSTFQLDDFMDIDENIITKIKNILNKCTIFLSGAQLI